MLHIYYPSSARNVVALLLSLIYYLTTTKRGHSKNPMSSSALRLTVSRTDHAAKKVLLIQDNSWVVCPTRKTSSFIFLQIPNLSFCTVRLQCQVHRLSHNQAGSLCSPSPPCSLHHHPWQRGVLVWVWRPSLESILSLRIGGSKGPKQRTVGKKNLPLGISPKDPWQLAECTECGPMPIPPNSQGQRGLWPGKTGGLRMRDSHSGSLPLQSSWRTLPLQGHIPTCPH